MSKYKSYENNKRKISKLVNRQNDLNTNIEKEKIKRNSLTQKLVLSEPIVLPFKIPFDLSFDFAPLNFLHDETTALLQTWQIVFERMDVKLIPYLKSEFVYRIGNGEGTPVDDSRFYPSSELLGLSGDFLINEIYQEIDLNNESDNIKKFIFNKSLYITPSPTLPDFEVKLHVSLMWPNHMV